MLHDPDLKPRRARSFRARLLSWRNRWLATPSFQRWAARNPIVRTIARRRARQLFDLLAGFTYSQTLLATVESGLLARLAKGPSTREELAAATGLSVAAAERLVRAAAAIGIAEEPEDGLWMLGRHGAALQGNQGAIAMIRHHRLLYADLAEPLALLKADRRAPTELSRFWTYGTQDGNPESGALPPEYSALMADSQAAVADAVLAVFPFGKYKSLLDIGGGTGAFLQHVGGAHRDLRLGLFDLPAVIEQARHVFKAADDALIPHFHPGSFFVDQIPGGYDLVSLVRILHDHDDGPAQQLLTNIRRAMRPGARLLIAEPMAETRGAEAMGDAYFGLYLWAMGSGRPRRAPEIRRMLRHAGFASSKSLETHQPLITSVIVATA